MGLVESIRYFDRGTRETFGEKLGTYARQYYQEHAQRVERRLLDDRQLYRYRARRNQLGVTAAADPLELRYVDPTEIRKVTSFHPHFCWRKIGAVKAGNWDLDRPELREQFEDMWKAVQARYVEGADWEDTKVVQGTLEDERHWHHHRGEEVWDWCEHLDELYESMRTDGYLAVREVLGMTFEEACESEEVSLIEWMDDIKVDIGRDGRVLRHDGKHRLWLADVLGIDEIPVCVVVRHRRWQRLRDEIAAAESVDELSDSARRHLDHPDMIDVRGSLSREETEPPEVTSE